MKVSGRIVVVDDAEANLMLLANLLLEAGHEVRVSNSAERALTLIRRQAPDLVLLDINLPDRDGFFVCREMKDSEALRAIPVIFLSAHDDAVSRGRAFEAGGAEYLTKPFDAAEVLSKVAQQLQLAAALREADALRDELSRARTTSESTFAALCASLVGNTLDCRYRLEVLTSTSVCDGTFVAESLSSHEKVSLRILPPSLESRAVLTRDVEGRTSYAPPLQPGVREALDGGVSESGVPYVVYRLEPGRSLADRLKESPGPSIEEIVLIARSIAEALAMAHAAGRAHGGLRPETVFLSASDHGDVAKLLDFGIGGMDDVHALAVMLNGLLARASGGTPLGALGDWISRALEMDTASRPKAADLVASLAGSR